MGYLRTAHLRTETCQSKGMWECVFQTASGTQNKKETGFAVPLPKMALGPLVLRTE